MEKHILPTIRGLISIPKGKSCAYITNHLKNIGNGRIDNIPTLLRKDLVVYGTIFFVAGNSTPKITKIAATTKQKLNVLYTTKIKTAISKNKKAQPDQITVNDKTDKINQ